MKIGLAPSVSGMRDYAVEAVDRLPLSTAEKSQRSETDNYRGAVDLNWYLSDPTLQFTMGYDLQPEELTLAERHLTRIAELMGSADTPTSTLCRDAGPNLPPRSARCWPAATSRAMSSSPSRYRRTPQWNMFLILSLPRRRPPCPRWTYRILRWRARVDSSCSLNRSTTRGFR